MQVSQLAVDVPEIAELDINPLLADNEGVIALDARIRVATVTTRAGDRLAIRPYPRELEEHFEFDGRDILLRPLRPKTLRRIASSCATSRKPTCTRDFFAR